MKVLGGGYKILVLDIGAMRSVMTPVLGSAMLPTTLTDPGPTIFPLAERAFLMPETTLRHRILQSIGALIILLVGVLVNASAARS